MSKKLLTLSLFLEFLIGSTGFLSGHIRDASTHQPLIGVNVIVKGSILGAATDQFGNFILDDVPVGSYTIYVSMIGYKSVNRSNVHVVPKRTTTINFSLNQSVLEGDGVEVTATYFEKIKDAVTSSRTVDIEEIRSDPVGSYDIMTMMQALPSVVSGSDQSNEIIVRGGSHGENLFVMDFLEIPYPNHYPEQGKGGGPITMVDTEFIERIDFYAGAFPARYGEKLSSVMDVTLREGNNHSHHQQMDINMAGFGFTFEGPLSPKSSYLYSLKRSFLDFVISSTGMQAIPEYWSSQGKIAYHLSPTQKIYINFIGGIDEINIEGEDNPQLRGAENVDYSSWQTTLGVTYKNLFSKKGYFQSSFGKSLVALKAKVYELDQNLNRNYYFNRDDLEDDFSFRSEIVYKFSNYLDMSSGLTAKHMRLDYDNWFKSNPTYLYGYSLSDVGQPTFVTEDQFYNSYYQKSNTIVTVLDSIGQLDTLKTNADLSYQKYGGFLHWNLIPFSSLELSLGARFDYISFTEESDISPRIGLKYHLTPTLKFNMAAGRYFQPPFNQYLNSVRGNPKELRNYYADQVVGGLEFFPSSDSRITLEYYIKEYADMVTFEMLKGSDGRDSLNYYKRINGGEGRSRGLELYIQKKYSNNWYGSFSWSHSISEGIDPRTKEYYPWKYDYRNVINLVGGYKIKYKDYDWYGSYKNSMIAKLFSWLPFMPSDENQISLKYRYMGGQPYTPKHYDHNIREWYTNANDEWNTERYPHYIRIDLMLQQRFHYEKVNLVAFWDIMNILNRKNPYEYMYLDDGTKIMSWQYTTFPVGGMILEF